MTRTGRTISEKILSTKCGQPAFAGDIVVCNVDMVIGTDASAPMAIDYFEQMGGTSVFDPSKILFALDHYSPPETNSTRALHERVRAFGERYGIEVLNVGDGISHQVVVERGRVRPGDLVVGADSHTVTCGALNLFATGIGSSDLAAAMMTGQIWLKVPETLRVTLTGWRPRGLSAKDVALALVGEVGAEGASYQAIEFEGPALAQFSLEERLVFTNLAVEMGAKTAMVPIDSVTEEYLKGRASPGWEPVESDSDVEYAREVTLTLGELSPRVAMPHSPDKVLLIEEAVGQPIQMVFIGTCTGGRVSDIHTALAVLSRWGGRVARGVQLVVTPASADVRARLEADGSLAKLTAMGAVITTPGCGACCGTSGVIPGDGMNVISTANRNFKARMGNATASIYLASPAACAAAAATGKITDPR
jgi:3-isopropylmalate/(R)-2-methylmalate dehydratase large subunit